MLRGRRFLVPQDVFDVAPEVLRHRLMLTYDALAAETHRRRHRREGAGDGAGAAGRAAQDTLGSNDDNSGFADSRCTRRRHRHLFDEPAAG